MLGIVLINISVFILLLVSIIFVGSINSFGSKFIKHLISIISGLVLFFLTSRGFINIQRLINYSLLIWLISLLVLILNLFFGTIVNGSRSWIYIGNFSFQPAELMKLSLVLLLAWFVSKIEDKRLFLIFSLIILSISVLPIFLQPDLGFTLLLFLTILIVNYAYGVNGFWVVSVLICAIIVGKFFMKPYQIERLTTFLDPYKDPLGSGWQTIQSVNCIINGGIWGQGLGNGMVSKLGFLPEKDTDFIFSVIVEELGFIGSLFIIFLFISICLNILLIYSRANNSIDKVIVSYIFGIIFVQSFINIAMNTMSGPITGLPLPLISYGGTNMVITLFLLGMINQIYSNIRYRKNLEKWFD